MIDIIERIEYELVFGEYSSSNALLEETKAEIIKLRKELKKYEVWRRRLLGPGKQQQNGNTNNGVNANPIDWEDIEDSFYREMENLGGLND